jgi:hypothetical protein
VSLFGLVILSGTDTTCRFLNNEKWRKEFGVEDLVRNFEYKEKPQVFQYYPQYYHKTDKVRIRLGRYIFPCNPANMYILGWPTSLHRIVRKN